MSNYPAQIDTNSSLPMAVDTQTPVQASVFNALRSAVIAVEATLGTQPNGVYGTVANRLTTLEGTVGGIVEISLAGDLGNTLATPHVIGIQGRPVNSMAPTLGQPLVWDGIVWTPSSAGGDVIGPYTANTVVNVHGVAYPASPATNTVPVVTAPNTVTYQTIANAQVSSSAAIAVSKLAAGTAAQVLLNNVTPTPTWTTITGNVSLTNAGVATVTGIQGNTVTAGALVESQLLIATSTSNWAPTTVTGDAGFFSVLNPGLITVQGIQGNTISPGYLIEGQFLVATVGGLGTSNWAPVTLTGDVSSSAMTPGKMTVTGLAGSTVPTPDGYQTNNQLTWTGTAMEWSLPVNTVGPQSALQHSYGQYFNANLFIQPNISVPGSIPVTSSVFGASYINVTPDPTLTSFFGPSVWFTGFNNLTRVDDNSFNMSQVPLDDLPGAAFTTNPFIVAMATGPQPGVPGYTKLYAFDATLGLFRINNAQGSFGVEANLPLSVFGGNSPTSICFDSYALAGTFTVTNGSSVVTASTSQTGVVSAGSPLTFGNQGAIYTVLSVTGGGLTINLTAPYTGVGATTRAAINNNQLILWFPFYNSVSTQGTLYFVSPDFTSVTSLLVDISGITGGFTAWESGPGATYANGTVFMPALGVVGSVIWAVGVNTLTHAVTHNIQSTATAIIGGNNMVFSDGYQSLYFTDGAAITSTIYTLSITSNTQTHAFSSGIDSIAGLALNDGNSAGLYDELAVINNNTFYTFYNLAGTLTSSGTPITLDNAHPFDPPFFTLYKYFSPPALSSITLDPFGGENFTGGPAYWVTDRNNGVVYNFNANNVPDGYTAPLFNQLVQPGIGVSWQPGPFTALSSPLVVGDSPYTTTLLDHYVITDTTDGEVDIHLTSGPPGTTIVVMDGTGQASTNPIEVTDSLGGNINGSASPVVMVTNWGVKTFVYNGTSWNAY